MTGEDAYRWLMDGADESRLDAFDIHVVASILAVSMAQAAEDSRSLPDTCGLDAAALRDLATTVFPGRASCLHALAEGVSADAEVEQVSVRDLLAAHASGQSALEPPLAAMIARRAMEPDHLWQDLGLRDRGELSALLHRHFAPLARQNTGNMKWKRFFYRMICDSEGFALCTTPICSDCTDFDMCFGEETGEARLARNRRQDEIAAPRATA